jgi:5-methylcytosine-specific restriction protein A
MPKRARRMCPHCQQAYTPPTCPCRRTANQQHDIRRGTARERGYDTRWEKARKAFLKSNPVCRIKGPKCKTIATVVDHIRPHRRNKTLFWDRSNWQPACEPCHNAKTASGQ